MNVYILEIDRWKEEEISILSVHRTSDGAKEAAAAHAEAYLQWEFCANYWRTEIVETQNIYRIYQHELVD